MSRPIRALAGGLALATALSAALWAAASAAGPAPRVVEIIARRFQFTPAEVTLEKDRPVLLRVRSEDVVHGFFSRPLGLDALLEPGKVTELAVTPHEAGTFPVICHHFCGAGHGTMNMKIVVR